MLKPEPFGRYFITDFEKVLKANGEVTGDVRELFNYIATTLFGDSDWRQHRGPKGNERTDVVKAGDAGGAWKNEDEAINADQRAKEEGGGKADSVTIRLRKPPHYYDERRCRNLYEALPSACLAAFGGKSALASALQFAVSSVIAKGVPLGIAETVSKVFKEFGGEIEIIYVEPVVKPGHARCMPQPYSQDQSEIRDNGRAGPPMSVWLKKIPAELSWISGEVLYFCGGPKRFRCGKLGVLCSNINNELAFKIKGEIEKAGGEVEIRSS